MKWTDSFASFSHQFCRISTYALESAFQLHSVTKFCRNRHFGNFLKAHSVFGKILSLLLQNFHAIGQIFIVVNDQIWNK